MRLHAVGGLCNRLRAILSYRALHGEITVVWDVNEYVSDARWDDVFGPIPGVTFEYHKGWTEAGWDVEDYAPAKGAPDGWERDYRYVRPVPSVRQSIAGMLELGPFAAMHVRRTDYVPNMALLGEHVEPLEDFVLWAEKMGRPVFLATDNAETRRLLGERLRFVGVKWLSHAALAGADVQALEDHSRSGSLSDAAVDLYVCVAASHFKGSRGSSFTDTIEILRRLRREGVT